MTKKQSILLAAILAAVVVAAALIARTLVASNAEVTRSLNNPTVYTEDQVNEAMDVTIRFFNKEIDGCTLQSLSYDEDRSKGISDETGTSTIVLNSVFTVQKSDQGLMAGNTETWQWYVTSSDGNHWEVTNYGYG